MVAESPAARVAALGGDFAGTFTFVDASTSPVALALAWDGTAELIVQELVSGGGEDSPYTEGAPTEECPSYYALPMAVTLAVENGALAETLAVELRSGTLGAGDFRADVSLEAVVGTSRPATFDPADWDADDLVIDAYASEGAWQGSVMWIGTNEAQAEATETDSESGTSTGTIEPSGVIESVGSFTARR